MSHLPQVLVLTGDGINCEKETALTFEWAGAHPVISHVNDLIHNKLSLQDFDMLAFPGGFSFGDDLGSGQVLGLKLKHSLKSDIESFIKAGRPVIGICNGFQVLVKLGLLPFPFAERVMALDHNVSGTFIDRWVSLEMNDQGPCVWTRELAVGETIDLPIRHGEGRVVFTQGRENEIYEMLKKKGQIVFRYTEDVNGSYEQIAGVCDPSGLVLGLMPHPEAFCVNLLHPEFSQMKEKSETGAGLKLFQSAVNYVKQRMNDE